MIARGNWMHALSLKDKTGYLHPKPGARRLAGRPQWISRRKKSTLSLEY